MSENKNLTGWTRCHDFNSSPPGQNGRHFADDICKGIFLNENVLIAIKISLNFIPNGPINNICWPGDKPFSEPVLTHFTDAFMRH